MRWPTKGGPNVSNPICARRPAGRQRSHFQPRLHHRSGVCAAIQGAERCLLHYDPEGTTWTAFFKLPEGGLRTVGKITSEDECKRYVGAFQDGIPAACRQLAQPVTCNVACVAPVPPKPTGLTRQASAVPPPPDPAALSSWHRHQTRRHRSAGHCHSGRRQAIYEGSRAYLG